MNQAQRTAALIVRLAGLAVLALGLMSLLLAFFVLVRVGGSESGCGWERVSNDLAVA